MTQKLYATAKNIFHILILHPKKQIFEKNVPFFNAYKVKKYQNNI